MKLDNLRNKHCLIRIVLISSLLAFSIGCSSTLEKVSNELTKLENTVNNEIAKLEASLEKKSESEKKSKTVEKNLNDESITFSDYENIYYPYSWGENIKYNWDNKNTRAPISNFYTLWDEKKGTREYKDLYLKYYSTYDRGTRTLSVESDYFGSVVKSFVSSRSKKRIFESPLDSSKYINVEDYNLEYARRLKKSYSFYNNKYFNGKLDEWLSYVKFDKRSFLKYAEKASKRIKAICENDFEINSIPQKKYLDGYFKVDICSESNVSEDMEKSLLNEILAINGYYSLDSKEISLILQNINKAPVKLDSSDIVHKKVILNNIVASSSELTDTIKNKKLTKNRLQTYINLTYERLYEEIIFTSTYGIPPINAGIYFDSLLTAINKSMLQGISGSKDINNKVIDTDLTIEQYKLIFSMLQSVEQNDRNKTIIEKYKAILNTDLDKIEALREVEKKSKEKNKLKENFQKAWLTYTNLKGCYTSRKGYLATYITKGQHDETERQWSLFKKASPLSPKEQEYAINEVKKRPNFGLLRMLGEPNANYSNERLQECSMYMLIEDRFSEYK